MAIRRWCTKASRATKAIFWIRFRKRCRATERLCCSVNAATTRAGINMDAVARVGRLIKEAAERTRDRGGLACAKFVCFANAVEDNPFMAGAFHGIGEPEAVLNVGVSGPGVVNLCGQQAPNRICLCRNWRRSSRNFRSNSRAPASWLDVKRRGVWEFRLASSILSLAPTPVPGDSVANIIEGDGI